MRLKSRFVVPFLLLGAGLALAQMSGTYTVKKDGTGSFTSVYAAGQALTSRKTGGNVVIEIYGGVYVEGYVYLDNVNDHRPQDTITFRPASGAKVTVAAPGYPSAFYGYHTDNVKIRDLTILSPGGQGLDLDDYCDGWSIERNTIRAAGHGLQVSTGCDYDSVVGNDIRVSGADGLYLYNGNNAYGIYIANNIITGWTEHGIYANCGYYWKILYNTVVGTGPNALYQYSQFGDTLKDNLLQGSVYAWYRYYGDVLPAYSNHNCFWNGTAGSNVIYNSSIGAMTLAAWQGYGRDGNSIQQDPLTGGEMNPHLKPGSPCINAGNAVSYVTTDIDGDSRTANTPDIGADEYTTVGAAMSGTYYIKLNTAAGDTFPSFYKANCALAVRGQAGSVTFEAFQGEYVENVDLTGLARTPYWVSYLAHLNSGTPDTVRLNTMSAYGVKLTAVKRIRFRNIDVSGYTNSGFYLYPNTAVSPYVTTDTIVIQSCNVFGGYPIYANNYYGGDNDSFYDNTLRADSSYGVLLYGSTAYENYNNYVANNMIAGWTGCGIYCFAQRYPTIVYNTVVGSGDSALCEYYTYGDTLKDNIFQGGSYAWYRSGGDALPAYSNYNAFWVNGGAGAENLIYNSSYGAMTLAAWQGYGRDGSSIQQNPRTGAPVNLHLRASSPCINAGNAVSYIAVDIDGDSRTANPPDIGADEFTTVGTAMSGVYTIKQDGLGDFPGFPEAFGALAVRGFGGDVRFDVYSGTYGPAPGSGGAFDFEGIGNGANRLVIRGFPGETAILNCAGFADGVRLYNNQRIHIENLAIVSPSTYGVYASSSASDHNTTDSCAVVNCRIDAPNGVAWYYGDFDTLAGNFINATSSYGLYVRGFSGVPNSQGNVLYNNIVQGWTDYGLYLSYQQNAGVVYNTIRGAGSVAFYDFYNSGLTLRDNNLVGQSFAMSHYYGDVFPASANYNNYRRNGGGSPIFHYSLGTVTLATWKASSGRDTNAIDADPHFRSAWDAHLLPSSPCINSAGAYAGIFTDIDGDPRTANPPDIGADEWVMDTLDVGITRVLSPVGTTDTSVTIRPSCRARNFGMDDPGAFKVLFRIESVPGRPPLYVDSALIASLGPGDSVNAAASSDWPKPHRQGIYVLTCSAVVAGDRTPANDTASVRFTITNERPVWWPKSPMPAGARAIKDGGWLAYDAGKARIYASRGYKQPDFFAYNPARDSWKALAPWLPGVEGKLPQKGSVGCADGSGHIYATKGNNTRGFWLYDAGANSWTQKKDVPLGLSNKKVKGGTDIVWAYKAGTGYAYLLKGYKNEFYRYNPANDSWYTLTPAPVGARVKWDKGSWLAYDDGTYIYAHKAKYHEFYRYDLDTDAWSAALAGMPIPGSAGTKKSKDGGCGAFLNPDIYALKGGSTREFWKYTVATNSWAEKETIPRGSLNKKVKAGADIVAVDAALYATKGNKSNELWLYAPGAFRFEAPRHDGVEAERLAIDDWRLTIAPNPLASGFAVLRYGLPKAGAASVTLYDITGRTVLTRALAAGRAGSVNLDLRHLSNGVYLVKFSSEGFASSQKLVVQR